RSTLFPYTTLFRSLPGPLRDSVESAKLIGDHGGVGFLLEMPGGTGMGGRHGRERAESQEVRRPPGEVAEGRRQLSPALIHLRQGLLRRPQELEPGDGG